MSPDKWRKGDTMRFLKHVSSEKFKSCSDSDTARRHSYIKHLERTSTYTATLLVIFLEKSYRRYFGVESTNTYIRTCIDTYIHTHIHTHTYTHNNTSSKLPKPTLMISFMINFKLQYSETNYCEEQLKVVVSCTVGTAIIHNNNNNNNNNNIKVQNHGRKIRR